MRIGAVTGGVVWGLTRPFAWVARARGWRWCVLVLAECLVAAACGVVLYLKTGWLELPEVGDPFDVAAFHAESIPAKDNAYALFARALGRYRPPSKAFAQRGRFAQAVGLRPNDPDVGHWLDDNREALALFLEGCARPDALLPRFAEPPDPVVRRLTGSLALFDLTRLALEEGARREQRGDRDGAWACYRAVLRCARLVARRGAVNDRALAGQLRGPALSQIQAWAADDRTTPAQLRRALDDVQALEALEPDDAYTVKTIYDQAMLQLRPRPGDHWRHFETPMGSPTERYWFQLWAYAVHPLRRARLDEPERSRRVVRLMTAQWLAYFATPAAARPPAAIRVTQRHRFGSFSTDFFAPGPDAPAAARAVTPEALARAFHNSPDARSVLSMPTGMLKNLRNRERADHLNALFTLVEALYVHEHDGEKPPNPEALLGPYLKSLPEEPVPLIDDTTPVIDDD